MILVDTSVWIDHLRSREDSVEFLLKRKQVLLHPFVIGEIALGKLQDDDVIVDVLSKLPQAVTASQAEFLFLIRHYLSWEAASVSSMPICWRPRS